MARSFIVVLSLIGLAAGSASAGDDRVCNVEDGCVPEQGTSALQMKRTASVSSAEVVEDDGASDDIYASLAEVIAGRDERPADDLPEELGEEDFLDGQGEDDDSEDGAGDGSEDGAGEEAGLAEAAEGTENARKCICGKAKFVGSAKIKQWRGMSCSRLFRWKRVARTCARNPKARVIQFLKAHCCEMSGECLCGEGQQFQGDVEIPHWQGRTCKSTLFRVCKAKEGHHARKYAKHMCCGAQKGCGGDLCPDGTELLEDKTAHMEKGQKLTCKNAAWWFEHAAPKDKCALVRHHLAPVCCQKEGYGSSTDGEDD